jgi:hypothetical protein
MSDELKPMEPLDCMGKEVEGIFHRMIAEHQTYDDQKQGIFGDFMLKVTPEMRKTGPPTAIKDVKVYKCESLIDGVAGMCLFIRIANMKEDNLSD